MRRKRNFESDPERTTIESRHARLVASRTGDGETTRLRFMTASG